MYTVLFIFVIIFLCILFNSKEQFKEQFKPLNDPYKTNLLKTEPIKIPYHEFLVDLNDNFKKELNMVQPSLVVGGPNPLKQKVLCDDNLNLKIKNDALNESFDKISSSYPNLLVFEGSEHDKYDQQAYINPQPISKHISEENKYSNDHYNNKIDPSLKNQNKTMILQDIKFQDPDFNYTIEKDDDLDPCTYKAHKLSEYTNPRHYLTSGTIYFPPRFMKGSPYKNTPLPKTTNLKLWTDMYNCCQNNF